MPGLLDYVKGYQDGGGVDIDPFADTTQADMLFKLGISVNPSAMGLLPTYDSTGADLAREAYRLRSDATRGQFTGNLLDLTQQSQQQQAGSLFAGHGGISRAMADVRQDVVSGYGQAAHEQYLDLQRDIHGIETGFKRELVSAIGDLDPDEWRFGAPPPSDIFEGTGFGGGIPTDETTGDTTGDTTGGTTTQSPCPDPNYSFQCPDGTCVSSMMQCG